MRRIGGLAKWIGLALAASVASPGLAQEVAPEPEGRLSFFRDPEDNRFDLTRLLERGGFIPVPVIITEPAVDGGLGFAGQFIRNAPPGSGLPPTRTIIGGAVTGNESYGAGVMRSGSFANGQWLYQAVLGGGTLNLDFYPAGRDVGVAYGNDSLFAAIHTRYRFGDSGFSFGPRYQYRTNELSIDTEGRFPEIEEFLTHEVALSALGVELHYDDRDNPLTPKNGLNAIFQVLDYDGAIGSEADFTSALAFGSWFGSRGDWTLAAMTKAETVSTGAPFFMQPAVDIRGVPASRYQGEGVVSAEIELRRQLTPRWGVLGFVGWGHAKGDDDRLFHEDVSAETWGGGVRYKIARKLGLDMGLDLAFGPEDTVFYIQFGHAWARDMD